VNDCTTRNTFVSEQQQQQQNPCTVIPKRALPPFSALLHFSLKPKMSKFSSFKPLFSKLAEKNKAACRESLKHQLSSLGLHQSILRTSQIGFGAVLLDPYCKARTLSYQ